ncbi:hypothetical protein JKF63_06572 [Porcisia hertigi]|uniref:Uncharacterized protein n=1 Tax=Porcisia hertigi TaxID=2761500 RepID=A0A836LIJ7_9TRYP|nr:hypothetical protein JKF63_06572 [Porcisia hertigi]
MIMAQVLHSLPPAGEYLVLTFSELMHTPRFRKRVWAKMRLAERCRLDALRMQALYGDAPVTSTASAGAANGTNETKPARTVDATSKATESNVLSHTSPSRVAGSSSNGMVDAASHLKKKQETPLTPTSGSSLSSPPPGTPRWFDVAGRVRYTAWVELRGRMSADVAAESFCAEFISLIRKYPHPTLLPLVEAALSTARSLACRSRATPPPLRAGAPSTSTTAARSTSATPAPPQSSTVVLQVRALQGDPAALALLWICRAYRLPSEFIVEPLSKALAADNAVWLTNAASTHGGKRDEASEKDRSKPLTTNPYLPYTMADACYPFTVALTHPDDAGTGASPPTTTTTVTTPEAAFVLLTDTFLAAYPHWMGVSSDPGSAAAQSPSSRVVERCVWVDELQHITRHVRTPILALLVHQATQRQRLRRMSASAAAAERRHLLRAVASHLHTYERWTMDRVLSRRAHQAQSVLWPLLASTAVVNCLQQTYAPDAKVVSAADTYISSCGYVLCTHPFCADVFPLLHVPPAPVATLHDSVQAQWPSPEKLPSEASSERLTGSATASYAPWAVPLHLSGIPAEYNKTINQLLRCEANGAMQQEQHQRPVRLFISDETGVHAHCHRSTSGNALGVREKVANLNKDPRKPLQAGYYAISASSITKEAAEAVQQLILTRMLSLRTDDLSSDTAVGSTSSVSGTPFLVIGHVFALTWALCQEQVPGFPYFMVDGNPQCDGGFSFLCEGAEMSPSGPARIPEGFQVSLSPAPVTAIAATADPGAAMSPALLGRTSPVSSASNQDGGASFESRFRYGWKAVTGTLVMGATRLFGMRRSADGLTDTDRGNSQSAGVGATHILRCGRNSDGVASWATAGSVRTTSRL